MKFNKTIILKTFRLRNKETSIYNVNIIDEYTLNYFIDIHLTISLSFKP